jgi:type II secretory pathway component PulM
MKQLSARERKLLAIGLLVAVFAIFWLGLVRPIYGSFVANADRRIELRQQYVQNERLIGQISALRRAAEKQGRLQTLYALDAPNAEQAGERLKARLEASVEKAGGELRATESVDAPNGWVRARATALVSNDQLAAWLSMLNNEQPYLAMETLSIVADRALNSGRLDLMDVKIEVSAVLGKTNAR